MAKVKIINRFPNKIKLKDNKNTNSQGDSSSKNINGEDEFALNFKEFETEKEAEKRIGKYDSNEKEKNKIVLNSPTPIRYHLSKIFLYTKFLWIK